ncbi:unnamed protein product [Hymenolepis diminuta]|uniref:Uncharacterized protein n=1 Tax=Hymenolepis diminuta TaxID=6216 RepID=A0A564Z6T9_HYMDI|nr:unnamed protein product [Hymenolepis diminuta]
MFIDKLDSISSVDLAGFNITDFPSIINVLFNLEHLDISRNYLRSFPDQKKCWRRIKSVNLR